MTIELKEHGDGHGHRQPGDKRHGGGEIGYVTRGTAVPNCGRNLEQKSHGSCRHSPSGHKRRHRLTPDFNGTIRHVRGRANWTNEITGALTYTEGDERVP